MDMMEDEMMGMEKSVLKKMIKQCMQEMAMEDTEEMEVPEVAEMEEEMPEDEGAVIIDVIAPMKPAKKVEEDEDY